MPKAAGPSPRATPPEPRRIEPPTGARARATFDKLLQAASEVLADTGFEKLTSNAICARAGLTPPAFYHYFKDKYEVLGALADRLLRRQNEVFVEWVSEYRAAAEPIPPLAAIEQWFQKAADFVLDEPGGIWTIRALRALPNLHHVRLEWQRRYTDQIVEVARPFVPHVPIDLLWSRVRILVEFSYVVDELFYDEDRIPRDMLVHEAARLIQGGLSSILEQRAPPPRPLRPRRG